MFGRVQLVLLNILIFLANNERQVTAEIGCVLNNGICTNCTTGMFKGSATTPSCTSCAKGLYQDESGQPSCKSCEAGKKQTSVGADNINFCVLCGIGFYADKAGHGKNCYPCTGATGEGATDCVVGCDAGTYKDSSDDLCKTCSSGKYTDSRDSSICISCLVGYFASDGGAVKCTGCPKGRFGDEVGATTENNGCKDCDAGRYSENIGQPFSSSCRACPQGKYSSIPAVAKKSQCKNCLSGLYSNTSAADNVVHCLKCLNGKYSELIGAFDVRDCIDCPAGYIQSDMGQTFCVPCTQGKRQHRTGSDFCYLCGKGRMSNVVGQSNEQCSPCVFGSTQSNKGQTFCQHCEPGTYQNAEQTDCVLALPTMECTSTDTFLNDSHPNSLKWRCSECPAGGDCTSKESRLSKLKSLNGWWRIPDIYEPHCAKEGSNEDSNNSCVQWRLFEKCNPMQDCQAAGRNETTCTDGTDNTYDLCSKCQLGTIRSGSHCVECADEIFARTVILLALVFVIVLVIFFSCIVVCQMKKKKKPTKNYQYYIQANQDVFITIRIVVSFMQVQLSMRSTLIQDITFPEVYLNFLTTVDFFNLDILDLLKVQCYFSFDFTFGIVIGLSFVLLVVTLTSIIYFICKHNIRGTTQLDARKHIMGSLFDLSDCNEQGEIDGNELFLLLEFVAGGKLQQSEIEKLKTDPKAMHNIMLRGGALAPEDGANAWKLSRQTFINAACTEMTDEKDSGTGLKQIHHFVPALATTKQMKQQMLWVQYMSTTVQILFLVHTPLTAKVFQYFDCHELGNAMKKLRQDYSLECYTGQHETFLPVAIVLLVGFSLFLPLLLSYWLFHSRQSLHTPSTRATLGWLYSRFTKGAEFWDVFEMLRTTCLSGGLLLLPDNIRATFALLICMISCCTFNYLHPPRNNIVFWVAEATLLVTTLKYLIAVVGMNELGPQEKIQLGYVLVGLDVCLIVGLVGAFGGIHCVLRRKISQAKLIDIERIERRKHLNSGPQKTNNKPTTNIITRVLVHDKIEQLTNYKEIALAKIRKRARENDRRLRLRLATRRKKEIRLTQIHPRSQQKPKRVDSNEVSLEFNGVTPEQTEKARCLIQQMIKTEKRLLAVLMIVVKRESTYHLSFKLFETFCLKIFQQQKTIDPTPQLVSALWDDAKLHRKYDAEMEICEDTLRSWLQFEDMDVMTEAPTKSELREVLLEMESGKMTTQSFLQEYQNECNSVRLLLKSVIKTNKRLHGIFKIIDVDFSQKMSKVEFKRMVVKVSRKKISAKINDSLLEALWEDAKMKCKHESNFELDIEVLIDWFKFNVVENHPQTQKKRAVPNTDSDVVGGTTKEKPQEIEDGLKKEKDKEAPTDEAPRDEASRDEASINEAPKDEAPINVAPTETRTEARTEASKEVSKEVPPNESGAATTANKAQGNQEDETNDSVEASGTKVKEVVSLLIQNEKRLGGLLKMINKSKEPCTQINQEAFEKLVKKVLKKQKEINTKPDLLKVMWKDVISFRADVNRREVLLDELCCWLGFRVSKIKKRK